MTETRIGFARWSIGRRVAAAVLVAVSVAAPITVRADTSCVSTGSRGAPRPATARWPAPLDRVVTLHGRDMPLRDALDRLAAAARVRLSYVSELLPLDRRVCDTLDSVTVGDALVVLLRGTTLEPVVAGPDQVVLAPSRERPDSAAREPLARRTADVLDRVVVTGSATGAAERSLSVALEVVSGKTLEQRGIHSLAEALDESVPGMWMWSQGPSAFVARYGSIRGASSFQLSYPKIYIDGIEVANPLLLTQFGAESIDRIEVIRGPQGAALYGADAISGVINIVTRHEGEGADGQRLTVRSDLGMSRSDYSPFSVVTQEHAMTMHAGSSTRSAGLALSYGSLGDYIPGGASRKLAAHGDVRIIGARSVFTAFARAFSQRAGPSESPLVASGLPVHPANSHGPSGNAQHNNPFDSSGTVFSGDPTQPQAVSQYTVGATARFAQSGHWSHAVVFGIDGYRLRNVAFDGGPIPSPTDSALRAARGSADRGTMRLSSVAHVGSDDRASATLTFAVEHSLLREATAADQTQTPFAPTSAERAVAWRVNTGFIAQSSLAFRDALFLTGGLRLERNDGYTAASEGSALPMLGAAFVRDLAGATLKVRAAYGKGTRPPRTSGHDATWMDFSRTITPLSLRPEVQSGIEAGADLLFGRALSLHATRFDQRASDLIQAVAIATQQGGGPPDRRVMYQLQNVGEIANRGWELQGTAQANRLVLTGALSIVDSRVVRVTEGYSGDLRPGDRMLEVPARTLSLTASWYGQHWFASWRVVRASDWINYDRLALAEDLIIETRGAGEMVGSHLRDYWRDYGGVTRLRASFSRDLGRGMALTLTGDNLLNRQRSEPDNVTIVPGRTIAFGLRASF